MILLPAIQRYLTLAALVLFPGCATKTTYYWGEYEDQVYLMYVAPDEATAMAQIEKLELDVEKARSENKPLAPGVRAHMGFLYFQLARLDEARLSFEAEKAAFPESTKLMDRLISQL